MGEFWNRGYYNENLEEIKNFIEEILKHRESNYYPWALYISLNQWMGYSGGRLKDKYGNLPKEAKGGIKKHNNPQDIKFLEEILEGK